MRGLKKGAFFLVRMTGIVCQEQMRESDASDEFEHFSGSIKRDTLTHDSSVNVKQYPGELVIVPLEPVQKADSILHIFSNVFFVIFLTR